MAQITTTTREGKSWTPAKKAFAWSYSKLKNFRACPKRHYHVDIARDVIEEESDQLAYGNTVHTVMAQRVGKGTILPPVYAALEPWADKILQGPGEILVEQKLAITESFAPCEYFAKDAWYRGVGDVVKVNGPVALVVDWKTGKVLEDGDQLGLMAQCIFSHYPEVQRVRSEYVWLKHDARTTAIYSREDMIPLWTKLLPEVQAMKAAHEATHYPPTPNYLCRKWCPVTACPHNGA